MKYAVDGQLYEMKAITGSVLLVIYLLKLFYKLNECKVSLTETTCGNFMLVYNVNTKNQLAKVLPILFGKVIVEYTWAQSKYVHEELPHLVTTTDLFSRVAWRPIKGARRVWRCSSNGFAMCFPGVSFYNCPVPGIAIICLITIKSPLPEAEEEIQEVK
jgi:hypothetical protein